MFEEKFFVNRKMNPTKLKEYGFTETSDGYRYETIIMDGTFELSVFIASDGFVSTQIIETSTNEEYLLYRVTSSVGAYVGKVKAACEGILADISQKCYDFDVFHGEQAASVTKYVKEKCGDELEFLWEKFPNNAVWRRRDNKKWYGLIFTISKTKLGLDADNIVEAIDLRMDPEEMVKTVDHQKFFPGWHMNKKSWYTIILDGSVPIEEIYGRIDKSYGLAVK